jgi:hypothetical protein
MASRCWCGGEGKQQPSGAYTLQPLTRWLAQRHTQNKPHPPPSMLPAPLCTCTPPSAGQRRPLPPALLPQSPHASSPAPAYLAPLLQQLKVPLRVVASTARITAQVVGTIHINAVEGVGHNLPGAQQAADSSSSSSSSRLLAAC